MARRAEERAQARRHSTRWIDLADALRDDFELLGELGRGGSAIVYHARERRLGRDVAIKVVRGSSVDDPDARVRLEREARTVARLDHPNIVTLYGARAVSDDGLALIMRFVPGHTLRATLDARGALEPDEVEQIVRDIATALDHAHRHGIVHRDVKPENIFIEDQTGRALLSDFGIARTVDGTYATIAGIAVGTPTYMSPEQIDGSSVDGRSDLYSLGIVAWEMLGGHRPWDGDGLYAILFKQKSESLPPLDELRTDVPEHLVYAVEGMLMKHREERFASAEALLAQLDRAVPPAGWRRWHARRRREFVAGQRAAARTRAYADARAHGASRVAAVVHTMRFDPRRATPEDEGATVTAAADAPTAATTPSGRRHTPFADARAFESETRRRRAGLIGATLATVLVFGVAEGILRLRDRAPTVARVAMTASISDSRALQLPIAAPFARESVVRSAPGDVLPTSPPVGSVAAPAPAERRTGPSVSEPADHPPPRTVTRRPPAPIKRPARSAAARTVALGGVPRPAIEFAADLATLVTGGRHSCAIGAGGIARCWGADDRGQLGDGARAGRALGTIRFTRIAAGLEHTCAITPSGEAFCWGENDRGQLGDGTTTPRDAPVRVTGAWTVRLVRAGGSHSCALTTGGEVICWGSNARGQLGAATESARTTPVLAAGGRTYGALSVGWQHTCAIAMDGTLFCWGSNSSGQLGDGTRTDRRFPTRVQSDERFIAVAAGGTHTCAISAQHRVECWGGNDAGQLGIGTTDDRLSPTPVAGALHALTVTTGRVHTCARTSMARLLCWGQNRYGQLGDGTTDERHAPVSVMGSLTVVSVQASGSHTCALDTSGDRWCWGYNVDGQLGDGTRAHQSRPVRSDGAP